VTALDRLIQGLDDTALAALASEGLLRRAKAALDQPGAVLPLGEGDREARLQVAGQTVRLDSGGLHRATCDCPATGICRHVLMAVLALRGRRVAAGPSAPSARAEIAALGLAEIEAFAGSDWPEALRIAARSREAVPEAGEASCTVTLADDLGKVVFTREGGLRKALHQGLAARRRPSIAAAALILGQHDLPAAPGQGSAVETILLDQAKGALADAFLHGLCGDPLLAQDRLFDVAVSARTQAAPRLAAVLREAAHRAGQLARRGPQADPVAFLAALAEAHALVRALVQAPDDPALCGTLRRDYKPAPPLDLAVLGVNLWHLPSGARGVTIHGWDGARYLSSGPARAAGADPTFDTRQAYRQPWWTGPPPSQLAGQWLHLPTPGLAPDGVLAGTGAARLIDRPLVLPDLPLHPTWAALRADVTARRGIGLRATDRPLPALIAAGGADQPGFSDIAQRDLLNLVDTSGRGHPVLLPDAQTAAQILACRHLIRAALVEVSSAEQGLGTTLVSLFLGDAPAVWNVTVDPPPRALPPAGTAQALRQAALRMFRANPPIAAAPAVAELADRVLSALCGWAQAPRDPARLAGLADEAAALGLRRIASALTTLAPRDPDACLRLAWDIVLIRRATR
jgi:hypothetical protein